MRAKAAGTRRNGKERVKESRAPGVSKGSEWQEGSWGDGVSVGLRKSYDEPDAFKDHYCSRQELSAGRRTVIHCQL